MQRKTEVPMPGHVSWERRMELTLPFALWAWCPSVAKYKSSNNLSRLQGNQLKKNLKLLKMLLNTWTYLYIPLSVLCLR